MWLYTLPHNYLIDLSRQGRQKGVRICLLFHKASSIFIGFHAGVNIESKTFFCLTDRHTSQLTVLPRTSTFVWLHHCTTVPRKDKMLSFPHGCKHRTKTFFASPTATQPNPLSGDVIICSGHLLLFRCTVVRW